MRRVLIIAYYFPPMGLSGVQRTAKFARYLPEAGWEPTVLTVRPGGYYAFDDQLLEEVEGSGVRIERTASLDPTRLFGKRRRVAMPDADSRKRLQSLTQWLFIPDNKVGWMPAAFIRGLQILRKNNFDAIFSTAPPYTSHLIGASLSRAAGVPLILDFRDGWLDNPHHAYPTPIHRKLHAFLERISVQKSVTSVCVNTYIRDALAARLPHRSASMVVIPHGYDAEDFEDSSAPSTRHKKLTFLYSGIFYGAQTPVYFLEGMNRFLTARPEARKDITLSFVGHFPEKHKALIDELGLGAQVELFGYRPHREAVRRLSAADIPWMTVGRQRGEEEITPGKLFEYFGARKPVLGLVPRGAARDALASYGAGFAAPPDEPEAIAHTIEELYARWNDHTLPQPNEAYVQSLERRRIAQALADLLEQSTTN